MGKDYRDQIHRAASELGVKAGQGGQVGGRSGPPFRGQRGGELPTVPPPPPGGYFEDSPGRDGPLKLYYVERKTVDALAQHFASERLTMHQLRRFYRYCTQLRSRLRRKEIGWQEALVQVQKLHSYAADAAGKRDAKIPPSFHAFIRRNVDIIKTERDFVDGFMEHFECVVGFCSLTDMPTRGR